MIKMHLTFDGQHGEFGVGHFHPNPKYFASLWMCRNKPLSWSAKNKISNRKNV